MVSAPNSQNPRMQQNTPNNGRYEIDLLALAKALLKNIKVILLVTIAATILGFLGSFLLIPKTYRTSFTLYVNNRTTEYGANSNLTSSDISAARSLASTYAEIIQGKSVLTEAASRCGLDSYKYDELKELVEAQTDTDTEIITVYVIGTSPENALYYAQSIAQVAEEKIATVVDGTNMQVIDEPTLPEEKYKPENTKNALIVGLLAAVVICGIYTVQFLQDDRIKDDSQLEATYGIPVVGSIPDVESARKHGNGYYGYGNKKSKKKGN